MLYVHCTKRKKKFLFFRQYYIVGHTITKWSATNLGQIRSQQRQQEKKTSKQSFSFCLRRRLFRQLSLNNVNKEKKIHSVCSCFVCFRIVEIIWKWFFSVFGYKNVVWVIEVKHRFCMHLNFYIFIQREFLCCFFACVNLNCLLDLENYVCPHCLSKSATTNECLLSRITSNVKRLLLTFALNKYAHI